MSRKTGTPYGVAILDKHQWMKAKYIEGEGLTLVPQANAVTVQAPTVRIRALFGSGSRNILAVVAMGVSVSVHTGLQKRTVDHGIMKIVVV